MNEKEVIERLDKEIIPKSVEKLKKAINVLKDEPIIFFSLFIQELGKLFGYDKSQQDGIIQPVMAALMVRKSLFSY